MKNITASLDKIAETLQHKGMSKLAEELDAVSNSLEVIAKEEKEVEAAALNNAIGAGILALCLVTSGKAMNMDKALDMLSQLSAEEKTKVFNEVKPLVPDLQKVINEKTKPVMEVVDNLKSMKLETKGPKGPASVEDNEVKDRGGDSSILQPKK